MRRARAAGAVIAIALSVALAACSESSAAPVRAGACDTSITSTARIVVDTGPKNLVNPRTVCGPALALGSGTVHTYLTFGSSGTPRSLGIAFSESALVQLPTDSLPGMPRGRMLALQLPPEASVTGFDHVMLNWNPFGHQPTQIYGVPHMDAHFYTISVAAQMAMSPSDPQFATKLYLRPAAQYFPQDYFQIENGGIPLMGSHWADLYAPELGQPPAPFTRTFLYGSYDGQFIFLEPMVTLASMIASRDQAQWERTLPVKVAPAYQRPGWYPTRYSVSFDAATREYRISLDSLVQR